ncbi:hypothetical protein BKA65DRAFT_511384 [Rhexocercosporidium sp. MPI-PUGE-AT-0058]|nr:hypothetical protein BKA65DRAFT_511384 [Rhexocercosporidium sp. MPI-PUGE-AT-0058]
MCVRSSATSRRSCRWSRFITAAVLVCLALTGSVTRPPLMDSINMPYLAYCYSSEGRVQLRSRRIRLLYNFEGFAFDI